jgi:hypothetical protein
MDDDEIMNILREALSPLPETAKTDAPPAHVVGAALAAGDWLRLDHELAELVADSTDRAAASEVRGAADSEFRQLTYRFDDLTIDCELTPEALRGQAAPAERLRLELVAPDGRSTLLDVGLDGRFLVQPPPVGPVGIRCVRPGRPRAMTPWFLA